MKFIVSLLVAVIIGSFSCSAADLDPIDYYSLSPVQFLSPSVNSALDYAVQPMSATSWDTSDQTNLARIMNAFYNPNYNYVSNSIIGWVKKLADNSADLSGLVSNVSSLTSGAVGTSNSILWYAREIYNHTSELHNIYLSASSSALSLEEINDAIQNDNDSLQSLLSAIWGDTEDLLSSFDSFSLFFSRIPVQFYYLNNGVLTQFLAGYDNFRGVFSTLYTGLWVDSIHPSFGTRSLYGLVSQLQQVLASDDDLALANSQKANREEIESEFLTGSSGSTSLGVSDFGDLADVGGTIKDSLSLDGNATIGSFTSGLAAADSAGQGWFSETTRSQLDAVSSTLTYSLRDPDPYNMSGWEDRYYWLLGDDG